MSNNAFPEMGTYDAYNGSPRRQTAQNWIFHYRRLKNACICLLVSICSTKAFIITQLL
jgi:hypothetical protein